MIARLGEIAVGLTAALRTPLWLSGGRFQLLVRGLHGCPQSAGGPGAALRVSRSALRVLGRIPLTPWRNTCLYRSVAECLVLRAYGIGCRLQLGVQRGSAPTDDIEAHAWVLRAGQSPGDTAHTQLRPSP